MTSMSHHNHQAMTSWHPGSASITALQPASSYHMHLHNQQQQDSSEPNYQVNPNMSDLNCASSSQQSTRYGQRPADTARHLAAGHHQLQAQTGETAGTIGVPVIAAPNSRSSDITQSELTPSTHLPAASAAYMPLVSSLCRKTSPSTPTQASAKGLDIMPSATSGHLHHHHHQESQSGYVSQEPTMTMGPTHDQRLHHIAQPYSHNQQAGSRLGQPESNSSNNYYDTTYQECHQDYYSMIHQQQRAIDPFQHHHSQPLMQQSAQVAVNNQSWPNLSQSTSPQVATSPAFINQFHLGGAQQAQPNPTASVSPYANHANSVLTNDYQLHQQQPQQQQHYAPSHHHNQAQHSHHHHAMMQTSVPDDVFTSHQHQHSSGGPAYDQFSQRSQIISAHGIASTSLGSNAKSNTLSHHQHHIPTQSMHHQSSTPVIRHYTANIKVPSTTSDTRNMGANLSPKLHSQNSLASPASVGVAQLCRRQSSSVISTSSVGSNLSDHQSPTNSPTNGSLGSQINVSNLNLLDQSRQESMEDRLSASATDTEQEVKESQLSQLHQQCAVILDEQQHGTAINSPSSINNGTNATNSTTNNSNNNGSTASNGNNPGRSKRLRTSFKHNQLKEMKRWFSKNQNPDAKDLKTLAQTTGLSKRVLQVSNFWKYFLSLHPIDYICGVTPMRRF